MSARNEQSGFGMWMMTGMGFGLLRPAPGTWGSLPPVALALVLAFADTDPRTIDMALAGLGMVFGLACLVWGEDA